MSIPRLLRRLRAFYVVQENDPVLAAAQFQALARQILILYAILALNVVALAYTHYGLAPAELILGPPVLLIAIVAVRSLAWMRAVRQPSQGPETFARLQVINLWTLLLGIGLSVWAATLMAYGGLAENMQGLFFLTVTMMVCVQCLMHLRTAARILTTIAIPFSLYFLVYGAPLLQVTIINYLFVLIGMTMMQKFAYGDFRRLVALTAATSSASSSRRMPISTPWAGSSAPCCASPTSSARGTRRSAPRSASRASPKRP